MSLPSWFQQILYRYGVPFEVHHHPATFSALRLAEVEHVSGHRVAKTVFVSAGGRPVGVVLPATVRLDLERVRAVLGDSDVRLASEEEIGNWFKGCALGAVPPLRLRSDQKLFMDRSLAHLGTMLIPAGTPEEAVVLRFRDWYRVVRPGVGRFGLPNPAAKPEAAPAVLVVEDEHDTNQLMCTLLEQEGFACQGAEQGTRALILCSEWQPAAIVLDLMLPDMSGFDVYERLRRAGPLKRPPVMVVTALHDEDTRRRGLALGVDAFLTKPFAPEELVAELHGVLADARA
jgi:CheY-like chemotaxis protein/prolyl-tRNA editing enzyme YbaK/EbsC (Cys-tRNA(Pro) deacylase)